MSEVSDRYNSVADGFVGRLAGVTEAQWADPTPCTEWTVRDLVAHVVGTQRMVGATLGGEAEPVDDDVDLGTAFAEARALVERALADPEKATTVVGGTFGVQPFESLVSRLLVADTLIHTWDLARATGQDEQLDANSVATATAFLTPIDEAIRRPGGFSAKLEPAADADQQSRLLAFCGRAV
ncbi:MAG: TIGR03086 family metal-binding protein [Acidimicrobiales bacterium]